MQINENHVYKNEYTFWKSSYLLEGKILIIAEEYRHAWGKAVKYRFETDFRL